MSEFEVSGGPRPGEMEAEKPARPDARGRRRFPRWLAWGCGVALVLLVVAGAVVAYVLHNAEPILRRRVIASLEQRFQSPVELDVLHISLLRGLQVTGSGLRILPPGEHDGAAAPMLSVKSFEFRTGLRALFEPIMRVKAVEVQGMELRIPPKDHGGAIPRQSMRRDLGKVKLSIRVDEVVCSDATLTIETNQPGKEPLVFAIRDLRLNDVGPGKAFPFEARLLNAKPVGEIHSTGHFGPWQGDDPRQTQIDGDYSFTNADLGSIKGISGTLNSTGRFGGTLGEIGVTGRTDTPDFALDMSEHPMDLRTQFDATVDGTTGDTKLNSVQATLRHTVLQVSGTVEHARDWQGVRGHTIDLAVASDQARIEDMLTLGMKTSPALMLGGMTLRARVRIPPGHASVTQKMRVEGTIAVHGATFANPKWQDTVDKLSARASGNPKQANATEAQRVASQMIGGFSLANAVLDVPKLDYRIPGAQVDLAGKYSLDGKTFAFNGTARTQATASQMLTGWKSILAMPFDRLLKKDGAGVEVPIKVDGTRSDVKFGVDMDKLGSQIVGRHKGQGQQGTAQKP